LLFDLGVRAEHLHTLSNDGFWSKAGKPVVKETIQLLFDLGVCAEHLHTLSSESFWAKAGTQAMHDTFQLLKAFGVRVEHLKCFKGGFWSLAGSELMSKILQMLLDRNVHVDNLKNFGHHDSFWSAMKTTGFDVVDTLMDTYGVSVADLHKLQCGFWSRVSEPPDWEAFNAELAACPTSGAVTALLQKKNGRALGAGATRCMFARPIHTPTPVATPPAKQSKLTAFFQ
jgi:hypothetical protein